MSDFKHERINTNSFIKNALNNGTLSLIEGNVEDIFTYNSNVNKDRHFDLVTQFTHDGTFYFYHQGIFELLDVIFKSHEYFIQGKRLETIVIRKIKEIGINPKKNYKISFKLGDIHICDVFGANRPKDNFWGTKTRMYLPVKMIFEEVGNE